MGIILDYLDRNMMSRIIAMMMITTTTSWMMILLSMDDIFRMVLSGLKFENLSNLKCRAWEINQSRLIKA
jgi:hypothetical protein